MGWWDDDWGDDWYDFGSLVVWTTDDSHHPHQSWMVLDPNLDVGKDQFSESLRCNFWAIAMGESPRGMVICDMASLKRPWLLGEDHETMYIYHYIYTYICTILYNYIYMYHICIICCICITYIIYVSHILIILYHIYLYKYHTYYICIYIFWLLLLSVIATITTIMIVNIMIIIIIIARI